MGIKERWKNYPPWLKGGIIFGGIYILFLLFISFFVYVVGGESGGGVAFLFLYSITPLELLYKILIFLGINFAVMDYFTGYFGLFPMIVATIFYFLMGSLIGLVVDKSGSITRRITIGIILGVIIGSSIFYLIVSFLSIIYLPFFIENKFARNFVYKYNFHLLIGAIIGGFLGYIFSKKNSDFKKVNL